MMGRSKWVAAICLVVSVLLAGCASLRTQEGRGPADVPPVRRELRGVWVATVSNIDWPSEPGLPVEQQKAELLAILDRAAELNLNAVILQVRPAADALYDSRYEPWSEYLTGAMGRPPEPFYDPLEFAVQEAHRRGLELHAWFNPFRARHPSAESPISPDHLSQTHPELVRTYGTHLWMDPGEPAVHDHSIRVILDVVRRYDIDGVHLDDYFYPYKERDSEGNLIEFPDDRSWSRYVESGGSLSRNDWRRNNVDRFIRRLYREIKEEKPWVKFGISPIGTWRPGNPPQVGGFDAYDQIYADARKWLASGWLDYFVPQLYWPIARTDVSYPVLLNWWVEQNEEGRHVWPGNIPNRVGDGEDDWPASEILGQIYVTRGQPGATGNVHFSMRSLMESADSLVEKLATEAYAQPALIPASPWLWSIPPREPSVTIRRDPVTGGAVLVLDPAAGTQPTWWVIRTKSGEDWTTEVLPAWRQSYPLPDAGTSAWPDIVTVAGVDRTGNMGSAAVIRPAAAP